jgi:hypothetical protein
MGGGKVFVTSTYCQCLHFYVASASTTAYAVFLVAHYKYHDANISDVFKFKTQVLLFRGVSWGSSVSIVTGYGLDYWRFKFTAGARYFSPLHCIQTSSGAHPPPIQWISMGVKQQGHQLTTPLHLMPLSRCF